MELCKLRLHVNSTSTCKTAFTYSNPTGINNFIILHFKSISVLVENSFIDAFPLTLFTIDIFDC